MPKKYETPDFTPAELETLAELMPELIQDLREADLTDAEILEQLGPGAQPYL